VNLPKALQSDFVAKLAHLLRGNSDQLARISSLELKLHSCSQRIADLESKDRSQGEPLEPFHPWQLTKHLGNREWYRLLLESSETPGVFGRILPGFPREGLQKMVVGTRNQEAITHVWGYYSLIHKTARKLGGPISPEKRLLDFGVGWGRIYRFFLKDFAPGNLVGVDIDADFVTLCRELMPYGSFEHTPGHPPLSFASRSFDFVTAYSVFSHLSEWVAREWVDEFARVVKPSGLLFLTLLGERHLDGFLGNYHEAANEDPRLPELSKADCVRMHKDGVYLYAPSGGGGVRTKDVYGWANVEARYVELNWSRDFELVALVEDPNICRQNVLIMRRR